MANVSTHATDILGLGDLKDNLDQFFLIVNGMIVLFMQCGFAFLEAGAVRSKNSTNILFKNMLDLIIAGIAYWTFGYAFAFGDQGNAFMGYSNFASSWLEDTKFAFMFFQYVFAATAATIVSGAVAERCHFSAYLVYSFTLSLFIYPVVTHWAWDARGWLNVGVPFTTLDGQQFQLSFKDFAGSAVVHVVGGTASLVAAILIGPRLGRFDDDGNPLTLRGHSIPLAALGGFILIFGFLAFNGGSQGSISQPGDGVLVSAAVKNTILSGSFSGLLTLLINKLAGNSRWSLLLTINGALTGMVAICAGCDSMYPWGAVVVGTVAAFFYISISWLLPKCRVDDPLDAVAGAPFLSCKYPVLSCVLPMLIGWFPSPIGLVQSLHFGGGLWGILAVALFRKDGGIVFSRSEQSVMGLVWQVAGVSAIFGWTAITCLVMFSILKVLGILRVSREIEIKGLDIAKHAEPAYPPESYGHGWTEQITVQRLDSVDVKRPENYLYPKLSPQSGKNGTINPIFEMDVTDKGEYECPESIMHESPNHDQESKDVDKSNTYKNSLITTTM